MTIAGVVSSGADPADMLYRVLPGLRSQSARLRSWDTSAAALGYAPPACAQWPADAPPIAAVLDGRLYNEPELRIFLDAPPAANAAALLALGFTRWDAGLFDRLNGDFACALWDGRARRLLLARDPIATRPLFFWRGDGRVAFASTARMLQADPAVPRELNLAEVASSLTLQSADTARSLYRGIERVMPGHVAIIQDGTCRQERWWRPEDKPLLRLKEPRDYAEVLRETLDQAVASRLPVSGPAATEMSGGLDSTAVAALAARRLQAQGRRLTAFTMVPASHGNTGEPDRTNDETWLSELMPRAYGNIDHVLVAPDADADFFEAAEMRFQYCDLPLRSPSIGAIFDKMIGMIGKLRYTTALNGGLGNMTISYDGLTYSGILARQGRFAEWVRLFPGIRRAGFPMRRILGLSFGPQLPRPVYVALLRAFSRGRPDGDVIALRPEFIKEFGLEAEPPTILFDAAQDSRLFRIQVLQRSDRGPAIRYLQQRFGVAPTDPTTDRRVMDLCLSIPDEQYILNGEPRSLIRRAMRGLVPDAILDARKKGLQGSDFLATLSRARPQIVEEIGRMEKSPLATHCLDLKRMRQLAENWPADWSDRALRARYRYYFARSVMLGHFLRRFEGGNE